MGGNCGRKLAVPQVLSLKSLFCFDCAGEPDNTKRRINDLIQLETRLRDLYQSNLFL